MEIPKEIGSVYRFIVLSGLRVRQLQKGATPRVEMAPNIKNTQIAMRELAEGKINWRALEEELSDEEGTAPESEPLGPPTA